VKQRKDTMVKQKEMEKRKSQLAAIALLEGEYFLKIKNIKATRRALREARRWEEKPSKEYQKIEVTMLKERKLFGLAMKKLEARLKEAPLDQKLLEEQLELFGKLGLDQRFTKRVQLLQKVREHFKR
jgi:hypothetical protein